MRHKTTTLTGIAPYNCIAGCARPCVVAFLLLISAGLHAQSRSISLTAKNAPVKEALAEIEQKSGYRILYNDGVVPDDLRVSVEAENVAVRDLLNLMLQNTGLTFVLQSDELIVITQKEFTQATNQITGWVVDETGEPVPFANVVQLALPDSAFINGASTGVNGRFSLERKSDKPVLLEITFLGYERYHTEVTSNSPGKIQLKPETTLLGEVVVTANRPVFTLKNGNLITSVSNTILSKEHSALDVLTKIPGVISNRGHLEVFGSGQPQVYINNRKVRSMGEVAQLDVKNISSVELITNPGAQYDTDANAIIKIHTTRTADGLNITLNTAVRQSEMRAHYENILIGYQKGKFAGSAYYNFFDYHNKSFQYLIKDMQTDTVWQFVTDRVSFPNQQIHTFRFNAEYEINPKHSIGFQLNAQVLNIKDETEENNIVNADKKLFTQFDVNSNYKNVIRNPQLNVFYNAKWNERLSSDLNIDFVSSKNTVTQRVNEKTATDELKTHTESSSHYAIYAAKYAMNYTFSDKTSFVAGVDLSKISGEGDISVKPAVVNDLNYKSNETKRAAFAELNWENKNFKVNAGVRYENVSAEYDDVKRPENNVEREYHNVFPSFGISCSNKGLSNSLSFTVRTQRPQLSYLNGRTYYQNRFMHQKGNPLLRPQTSYIVQWNAGYRFFNFNASYTGTRNFISIVFTEAKEQSNNLISTWDNFDKAQFLKVNVSMQYALEMWTPMLSAGVIKPFMENSYQGVKTTYNKLSYYISFNNYFKLSKNYTLSANYYYNSGGSQRIFIFKPYQSLDLKIQKSFLDDRLSVSMGANDIFRGLKYDETAQFNNIRFYQRENYSSWNFFVDVIYRFNDQKTLKYKGKSAAKDEINRL